MNIQFKNSWIKSNWYDSVFILLPPFICLIIIAAFPQLFQNDNTANEWIWVLLIVFIDVGHVYSTIFRTYMDKETISKNKILFYLSPLLIYIIGVFLHSINPIYFWRIMTYLAVFHFIRQQYGFMCLYARNEKAPSFSRKTDSITIYAATLYPLLYWHLQGKQLFNWFVENDFIYLNHPEYIAAFQIIYIIILVAYVTKEFYSLIKYKVLNAPKNILIIGTIISWYMGIVYFKGDLTFTLLNVVSHGIPYYALVWAYGNKHGQQIKNNPTWLQFLFKPKSILFFLVFLFGIAYLEEMLWDGFIWKEHLQVFPVSSYFPDFTNNKNILTLLIPLLALPQLLHYFIDGFIWKIKKDKFGWSKILVKSE